MNFNTIWKVELNVKYNIPRKMIFFILEMMIILFLVQIIDMGNKIQLKPIQNQVIRVLLSNDYDLERITSYDQSTQEAINLVKENDYNLSRTIRLNDTIDVQIKNKLLEFDNKYFYLSYWISGILISIFLCLIYGFILKIVQRKDTVN